MDPLINFPGEYLILEEIKKELKADRKAHPSFPDHPAGQAGMVTEKANDIMHWSLQKKYKRGFTPEAEELKKRLREAAIATCVQSIRFIENLD